VNPQQTVFSAGTAGDWAITRIRAVVGDALPAAPRLALSTPGLETPARARSSAWQLQGVTSHLRYATRAEVQRLAPGERSLGAADATMAALIPITKSAAWWQMAQDERDDVFARQSAHAAIGLRYSAGIARKLYHCRDLGGLFDFLTWFEFPAAQSGAFDDLLAALRATPEWIYVEREVELRLVRSDEPPGDVALVP
jgi:hypothetical protein